MIADIAGPEATPKSGRARVVDALSRQAAFEEARRRSRTTTRFWKKPNLSGPALADQFCQLLRGFRATADGESSCLAYEDLTRHRDKVAVQTGLRRVLCPRGPGQFIVDAISRLPLNEQREVLFKVCTGFMHAPVSWLQP